MSLKESLAAEVSATFVAKWGLELAAVVPSADSLRLNTNHDKHLETAAVLYADLDGSTSMADKYKWWFAAEVYKAYLRCASQTTWLGRRLLCR